MSEPQCGGLVISVYTDGSSSGRSNEPGGWAWIILIDGKPFKCSSGGEPRTTNNRMELKAALEGLLYLQRCGLQLDEHIVELVADSQYVLGIASGKFSPSANTDLTAPLREVSVALGVRTRWVPGHTGEPTNERCDRFAKAQRDKIKKTNWQEASKQPDEVFGDDDIPY